MQRVPVRIALDPKETAAHPLRVGLSMDAKVDVSKTDGRDARRRLASVPPHSADHRVRRRQRRRRCRGEAASSPPTSAAPATRQRRTADRGGASRTARASRSAVGESRRRGPRRPSPRAWRRRDRAPAHAPAAPRAAPPTAADRRRARPRHDRALAGDVHERARHVDRQRLDPGDRRRHGREPVAGHLGHHLVRGRQRDLGAADRLADAALRPGAAVRLEHRAVRDRVVAVRPGAEHRHADRVSRAAGPRRRADDSALADAAAVELSARQVRHGDGDVGDDGAGRAGGRPAARRLDHRQHLVAVDLLHQHPGRPDRRRRSPGRSIARATRARASRRSTTSASACWWSGSARCRSWSTRARSSTGSTPAQIVVAGGRRGRRLRVLPGLGADREASDRRPAPVRPAQLPDGHALALGRLRPVLRQRRAAAALAAAVHGLHRHLGRPGDRAGRRAGDHPVALGRQERLEDRSAQARRRSPSSASRLVLWMRSRFNVQADFNTILVPTVLQGAAMAFFFIPLQAIIFSGLTPDRLPAAAGLSNFVRITAGAIGTSIFTTVVGKPRRSCTTPRSPRRSTAATARRRRRWPARRRAATTPTRRSRPSTAWSTSRPTRWPSTDLFLLSAVLFVVLLVWSG